MRVKRKALEHAMVDADLNGRGLAARAGVVDATISNLRNGRAVDRKTALAVCHVLGRTFEELFVDEDESAREARP